MAGTDRVALIRQRLEDALEPSLLDIVDEGHKHVGHSGAADGRGHFSVTIVSEAFVGLSLLERHRLTYDAVGDLMDTDIHALSIQARTRAEARS